MIRASQITSACHQSLLSISFFLLLFSITSFAETITIVADEWPPYNGEPESELPGYGIEIAKKVFEEAGHKIEYKIVPWARALKETKAGKYTALIGATKDEVPDYIFPDEEFGISENSFFIKKGKDWEFKGVDSLKSVKIGLIKGYAYGESLDAFFELNKKNSDYVHGKDPLLLNIKKLLAGRIDVIVEDRNVFAQKLKEMGITDKIVRAKSVKDQTDSRIYIAFTPKNKNSKEYAEIFTKGIRRLKKSGDLQKILDKYGLKYWK